MNTHTRKETDNTFRTMSIYALDVTGFIPNARNLINARQHIGQLI